MFRKYELDLNDLSVDSMEIDFAPSEPEADDPFGYQASQLYYTNTRKVPAATAAAGCTIA